MKLFILLSLFLATVCTAQTVPSSCDATDSVKERLSDDAGGLAISYERILNLPSVDPLIIPQEYLDIFMNGLVSIYNATGLPQRDTVFDQLRIYNEMFGSTRLVGFRLDTTQEWGKKMKQLQLPTGITSLDSIFSLYGITIDHIFTRNSYYWAMLKTDRPYKMSFIKNEIRNAFIDADLFSFGGGDTRGIHCEVKDSLIYITYQYGWGECEMGCLSHRYWQFAIHPDCSVTFIKAFGRYLPKSGIEVTKTKAEVLSLYPNPVTNKLIIEAEERGTAIISDVSGKEIQNTSIIEGKNELLVSDLPGGIYFVTIRDKNGNVTTGRFIKM